jgi:hypothetical protein
MTQTLRDYFAATASEEDIRYYRDKVTLVDKVMKDVHGYRTVHNTLPDNWRQQARYIHADMMLQAREIRQERKQNV